MGLGTLLGGMNMSEEELYHCEGCEQDLPIDGFGNHEELCNICFESACDKAEYLASVNAYLNEDRRRGM